MDIPHPHPRPVLLRFFYHSWFASQLMGSFDYAKPNSGQGRSRGHRCRPLLPGVFVRSFSSSIGLIQHAPLFAGLASNFANSRFRTIGDERRRSKRDFAKNRYTWSLSGQNQLNTKKQVQITRQEASYWPASHLTCFGLKRSGSTSGFVYALCLAFN